MAPSSLQFPQPGGLLKVAGVPYFWESVEGQGPNTACHFSSGVLQAKVRDLEERGVR